MRVTGCYSDANDSFLLDTALGRKGLFSFFGSCFDEGCRYSAFWRPFRAFSAKSVFPFPAFSGEYGFFRSESGSFLLGCYRTSVLSTTNVRYCQGVSVLSLSSSNLKGNKTKPYWGSFSVGACIGCGSCSHFDVFSALYESCGLVSGSISRSTLF